MSPEVATALSSPAGARWLGLLVVAMHLVVIRCARALGAPRVPLPAVARLEDFSWCLVRRPESDECVGAGGGGRAGGGTAGCPC